MPNSVSYLDQTLAFEWYANKCGSNNECQEYTCLKEIGQHTQNMRTISSSIVNYNFFGGDYMTI